MIIVPFVIDIACTIIILLFFDIRNYKTVSIRMDNDIIKNTFCVMISCSTPATPPWPRYRLPSTQNKHTNDEINNTFLSSTINIARLPIVR